MPSNSISLDEFKRLLDYDPTTGSLIWRERDARDCPRDGGKRWNGRYAGKEAFRIDPHGYRTGMVKRVMQRAHRLAWLLHYGRWPEGDIDHINGDRADNRIANLRDVPRKLNARNQSVRKNNQAGVLGVRARRGKWDANIWTGGKQVYLGTFTTLEAAATARRMADIEFGYHPNHGRQKGETK